MAYNREAHELLDDLLLEMVRVYGSSTAYAKMVGYLITNVDLDSAKRIAEHESKKGVVAR